MNIKLELISRELVDFIVRNLECHDIDIDKMADSTAIKMIGEIQDVIKSDIESDFDVVEEIVCIFEKYNIDAGCRHDF